MYCVMRASVYRRYDYRRFILHSKCLVAEFALDNSAYSLCEDEGPQVVFAELVNSVILATNIEVFVSPLPLYHKMQSTCCEMELL